MDLHWPITPGEGALKACRRLQWTCTGLLRRGKVRLRLAAACNGLALAYYAGGRCAKGLPPLAMDLHWPITPGEGALKACRRLQWTCTGLLLRGKVRSRLAAACNGLALAYYAGGRCAQGLPPLGMDS